MSNEARYEPRYNGPASNGSPAITEAILMFFETIFFSLNIGNKRNPPITYKNMWSLKIRGNPPMTEAIFRVSLCFFTQLCFSYVP